MFNTTIRSHPPKLYNPFVISILRDNYSPHPQKNKNAPESAIGSNRGRISQNQPAWSAKHHLWLDVII